MFAHAPYSRHADTGQSAYNLLHNSSYTPQPPSSHTGTLETILLPDTSSTSLLPTRRTIQRQLPSITSTKKPSPHPATRTNLSILIDLEERQARQKTNIARFGSTWLRPLGITRTKQAMDDEEAEAKEQDAQAQREAMMAEERAAQERAERAAGMTGVGMDAAMDEIGDGEEVDLDAEVPEASVLESEGDFEDEGDEVDGGSEEGDQENAVHSLNSLDGVDEEVERNLDDSIPEAGSYEHTDTELESSDEGVEQSRFVPTGWAGAHGHRSPITYGDPERRSTGTPASLGLDSSLISPASSPGAARGHRRGQSRRER